MSERIEALYELGLAALRDPSHAAWWGDTDESIPALLDAYGSIALGDENHEDVEDAALLIRALAALLSPSFQLGISPRAPVSMSLRLCVVMLLSDLATVSHDKILVEVTKCSAILITTTLEELQKNRPSLDDEEEDPETVQSVLSELDGLWKLVCSFLDQPQELRTDDASPKFFYSRRQMIVSAQSVLSKLLTTPGVAFAQPFLPTSATALIHAIFNRSHAVSIASSAAHSLDAVVMQIAAVYDPEFASTVISQLCKQLRDTWLEASQRMEESVVRPVRRLLNAAQVRLASVLSSTVTQSITACLQILSPSSIADAPASPDRGMERRLVVLSQLSSSPGSSTISASNWNRAFLRTPSRALGGSAITDDDLDAAPGASALAEGPTTLSFSHELVGVEESISVDELVSMVFDSLKNLPIEILSAAGNEQQRFLEKLHMDGLRTSQREAACRAQAEELDRIQRQEAQSIEDIPAGKLFLQRSQRGPRVAREAAQALERSTMRAALLKRSFLSVLKTFEAIRTSAAVGMPSSIMHTKEARMRGAQALVARTFTQLPSSVADAAADALLELFEAEIRNSAATTAQLGKLGSVYSLIMQALFMKYTETAPLQNQGQQIFGESGDAAILHAESTSDVLGAAIEVDNPIGWLSGGRMATAAATRRDNPAAPRKRPRDEHELHSGFQFGLDTQEEATGYSHFLNRCLAIAVEANRVDVAVDCLLQCPAITANTWSFLLHRLCLGERAHSPIGLFAVSLVAQRRPVYLCHAVSLLLFLAGCPKVDPRRLAISQLAKIVDLLVSSSSSDSTSGNAAHIIQTLSQAAKSLIARVPLIRHAKAEPSAISAAQNTNDEVDERNKLAILASVDRHMGLYLMLCSRRQSIAAFTVPRGVVGEASGGLLDALLSNFVECNRQGNTAVATVLLDHPDVHRLIQQLFRDPLDFLKDVLPVIRRYAHQGGHRLVQRILSVVAAEIRSQAMVQRTAASVGSGSSVAMEQLLSVTGALVAQAQGLFKDSTLTLGSHVGGRSKAQDRDHVRDIRFIAPFLSLIPRSELKAVDGPLVSLLQFTACEDYDEENVRAALKETFVKFPLSLPDGEPRGLSPFELMIFLHQEILPMAEGKGPSPTVTVAMMKSFLPLCLSLPRSFDRWAAGAPPPPLLYDLRECLKVLQGLLRLKPLPSLMMFTAIICSRVHREQAELTQFVVSNMLSHLAREAAWDSDPALWRDAQLFCEEHWQETHGFLFHLPDRVLLSALKENSRMREAFIATQSGNASFAHILSAL